MRTCACVEFPEISASENLWGREVRLSETYVPRIFLLYYQELCSASRKSNTDITIASFTETSMVEPEVGPEIGLSHDYRLKKRLALGVHLTAGEPAHESETPLAPMSIRRLVSRVLWG